MEKCTKILCHIAGHMEIDTVVSNEETRLITLGSDDLITLRTLKCSDINDQFYDTEITTIELPSDQSYTKIALHPTENKYLIGGTSKKVHQYTFNKTEFSTETTFTTLYESLGTITDIKYSPNGRYASIGSEEQKVVVIDLSNGRISKCRPGHAKKVINVFWSLDSLYVASISEDCTLLVFEVEEGVEPREVFKCEFTSEIPAHQIQATFSSLVHSTAYIPGRVFVQQIHQINKRWELRETGILCGSPILLVEDIGNGLLVVCGEGRGEGIGWGIWDGQKEKKVMEIEGIGGLGNVKRVLGGFGGVMDDGAVYIYRLEQGLMEDIIEEEIEKIEIDEKSCEENMELEFEQPEQEESEVFPKPKLKISDNLINTYPQKPLKRSTPLSNHSHFLYMSIYGYISERVEGDENIISVEYMRENESRSKIMVKNKEVLFLDMSNEGVCYGNENTFGYFNFISSVTWEKDWFDVNGVCLSGNWLAVANMSQIRFYDIGGSFIKSVCFDRPIISLQAYENLLAVVYHESVPLYESQMLSMKLFNVNQFSITAIGVCSLPLSVPPFGKEKGSILKWFGFSFEGMIFMEDSFGVVRAFSLEKNEWTSLEIVGAQTNEKHWIIGFKDYTLMLWNTCDENPIPTLHPLLGVSYKKLSLGTFGESMGTESREEHILWKRFCLDHEMIRNRLWNRNKENREQKHINYDLSRSIMSMKEIDDQHQYLDKEYYPIVKELLKSENVDKAVNLVKNCIRSVQIGKNLTDLFDESGYRNLAIDLEYFYEEVEKQIKYDAQQHNELKQLISKVEVSVKPNRPNATNGLRTSLNSSMPFSLSSQNSQNSSLADEHSHRSQDHSREEEIINPFQKAKKFG